MPSVRLLTGHWSLMKFQFALSIEGGAREVTLCLLTELGLIRHTLRQEQPYIMYSCSTLTEATGR